MKKIFFTLCLFILFSSLNAQWISLPSPINVDFHNVRFISPEVGWICGNKGTILKTTNGGSDWKIQNFDSTYVLNSIFFIDSLRGWAVGGTIRDLIDLENSVMLKTIDGGLNWLKDSCIFENYLCSIFFSEKNKGWITGFDGVLFTKDQGITWKHIRDSLNFYIGRGPFFSIDSCLWTACEIPSFSPIFKSKDLGKTWNYSSIDYGLCSIYSIYFVNKKLGWLVHVFYQGSQDNFALGSNILNTTDGGKTWYTQLHNQNGLFCVAFIDSLVGWAGGGHYREFREYFGNPEYSESKIFKTIDGGINWIKQYIPDSDINKAVCSIYPIINNICYAVGDSGLILKTINGGTPVKEENISLPKKFYLFQNYPNPFNPSTTIRYQIPTADFVTLKVFDILGKEVATLANEYKTTGYYEIEFNVSRDEVTSSLPSGIYFYQLTAGNFIETKKLVLMK